VHVYLALIIASLLLPILLSLPAIMKGIGVSVHDALSNYGIAPAATGADEEKASAAWMPRGLLLAIRNSMRQKKRLAITVAAMALVSPFSVPVSMSAHRWRTCCKRSTQYEARRAGGAEDRYPRASAVGIQRNQGRGAHRDLERGRGELQSKAVSTSSGVGIVALPHDTDLFRPRITAGAGCKTTNQRKW